MQVILRDDVDHLGYAGDVVDVRKGYWRNYLRPRGLATTATDSLLAEMAQRMERRRSAEARNETEAAELRDLLNRTVLTIPAHAGPQGKLYGSVTNFDVSKAIESARKLRVDPKKIVIEEPIKALGTYMVPIDVYPGVKAEIKTMIVESKEPAPPEPEKEAPAAVPAEGDDAAPAAAGDDVAADASADGDAAAEAAAEA